MSSYNYRRKRLFLSQKLPYASSSRIVISGRASLVLNINMYTKSRQTFLRTLQKLPGLRYNFLYSSNRSRDFTFPLGLTCQKLPGKLGENTHI